MKEEKKKSQSCGEFEAMDAPRDQADMKMTLAKAARRSHEESVSLFLTAPAKIMEAAPRPQEAKGPKKKASQEPPVVVDLLDTLDQKKIGIRRLPGEEGLPPPQDETQAADLEALVEEARRRRAAAEKAEEPAAAEKRAAALQDGDYYLQYVEGYNKEAHHPAPPTHGTNGRGNPAEGIAASRIAELEQKLAAAEQAAEALRKKVAPSESEEPLASHLKQKDATVVRSSGANNDAGETAAGDEEKQPETNGSAPNDAAAKRGSSPNNKPTAPDDPPAVMDDAAAKEVPSGVELTFAVSGGGGEKKVLVTRNPVGFDFDIGVPITIAEVRPKSHAQELGLQKGWQLKSVGSLSLADMNYEGCFARLHAQLADLGGKREEIYSRWKRGMKDGV